MYVKHLIYPDFRLAKYFIWNTDYLQIVEHNHDEHNHGKKDGSRLGIVAIVNFVGFIIELAGGIAFGSIALLSDAFHMLFDMFAYIIAYVASSVAQKYDNEKWGIGIHRIEPFAAFANGVFLLPMVGYILWESYNRYLNPSEVEVIPVIVVGIFGLIINLVSVYILNGNDLSMNEKGAFYHLLGDAGGSIAVIVSAIVVSVFDASVIDPLVAVLISVLILWSAVKVILGSGSIFFHRTSVNVSKISENISSIDGIENVNCIHTWKICSQITFATVHASTSDDESHDSDSLNSKVHHILSEEGVNHATVELRKSFSGNRSLMNHEH